MFQPGGHGIALEIQRIYGVVAYELNKHGYLVKKTVEK